MITLPIKEEAVLFNIQELLDMQDEVSFETLSDNFIEKKDTKILNNAVRTLLSNKKEIIKVKFLYATSLSKEKKYVFQIKYMNYIVE